MDKVQHRRDRIVEMLKAAPMVTIAELANCQHVTMETIRKDLRTLEKQGVITKIHGGAALAQKRIAPFPYYMREGVDREEKTRIAGAAYALINKGDSLLIESSTTTVLLCQEMLQHPDILQTLTIITNSLYISQVLENGALCKGLFFLGGWMLPTENATKGSYTEKSLSLFRVDKAFLGGAALDGDLNITAYYEEDMYFQRKAIESAKQSIVVLNSRKYHAQGLFHVCPLDQIDCLITDSGLPKSVIKTIRTQVECIVV